MSIWSPVQLHHWALRLRFLSLSLYESSQSHWMSKLDWWSQRIRVNDLQISQQKRATGRARASREKAAASREKAAASWGIQYTVAAASYAFALLQLKFIQSFLDCEFGVIWYAIFHSWCDASLLPCFLLPDAYIQREPQSRYEDSVLRGVESVASTLIPAAAAPSYY